MNVEERYNCVNVIKGRKLSVYIKHEACPNPCKTTSPRLGVVNKY